jgi:hypothetical protein
MDLDLSFSTLFGGFVFSVFGVYFIKRGKDLGSILKILIGVALLCVFLVPGVWIWPAGIALMIAGFKL